MKAPFDAVFISPVGAIGIRADAKAVTSVTFLDGELLAVPPKKNSLAHLACVQLSSYFDHPTFEFDLPVRLAGTKHQLDVWEAMRRIPPGRTMTYGELAASIGSNARAVGTACGKNPVPIIVPCHRIVASTGLGGFMGGKRADPLAIKRWLLTHERAELAGSMNQTGQLF